MLPKIAAADVAAECKRTAPMRAVEQIAEFRSIAAEALKKIDEEGTVVRTLKGDVIAHPAIRVHADAAKAEAALIQLWGIMRNF